MSLIAEYTGEHGDPDIVTPVANIKSITVRPQDLDALDAQLGEQFPSLAIKPEKVLNAILAAQQDDPKGNVIVYARGKGKATHKVVLSGALMDFDFERPE